jgi:hypothetical protein
MLDEDLLLSTMCQMNQQSQQPQQGSAASYNSTRNPKDNNAAALLHGGQAEVKTVRSRSSSLEDNDSVTASTLPVGGAVAAHAHAHAGSSALLFNQQQLTLSSSVEDYPAAFATTNAMLPADSVSSSSLDSDGFADVMSGLLKDINQGLAAMVGRNQGYCTAVGDFTDDDRHHAGAGCPFVRPAAESTGVRELLQREPSFGESL